MPTATRSAPRTLPVLVLALLLPACGDRSAAAPAGGEAAAFTCRAQIAAKTEAPSAGEGPRAATTTPTEIPAAFTGEGSSDVSATAACDAARAAACAAAGAPAGCVEAEGAFTQLGATSTRRGRGE